MAQTFTARQTAREIVAALKRKGIEKDVTDKRVRAFARDTFEAFDDDGYTTHAYDARTKDRIVAAFVAKYAGSKPGTTARARSASNGRAKPAASDAPKGRGSKPVQRMVSDAKPDADSAL